MKPLIGLKDRIHNINNSTLSFKHKITAIWFEVKLGVQRLWYGYDSTMVSDVDIATIELLYYILSDFKQQNDSAPNGITMTEWQTILTRMTHSLSGMYKFHGVYGDYEQECYSMYKTTFFKYFQDYFEDLWF